MVFLTDFADQAVMLPLALAVALALAVMGWRRGAVVWLCVVCGTFGLMLGLKFIFMSCSSFFAPVDLRSPSGHVAAAAVVAGGLSALLLRRRISILPIALAAALLIGVSRVVLGMHSLPEVVLGAVVGVGGAVAMLSLDGPPQSLRPGRLIIVVVLVAALFHGWHLPAEAAIQDTALRAAKMLEVRR